MARIRSLKPESWRHRKVRSLSREARLFWVVLITQADDEGRFHFLPAALLGEAYPGDEDVSAGMVRDWMTEVENAGLAVTYEVGDTFGALHDWADHQKISKPTPSRIPDFPGDSGERRKSPRESRGDFVAGEILPAVAGDFSCLTDSPGKPRESQDDLQPRIKDQGSSSGGGARDALPFDLDDINASGSDKWRTAWLHEGSEVVVLINAEPADVRALLLTNLADQAPLWRSNGLLHHLRTAFIPAARDAAERARRMGGGATPREQAKSAKDQRNANRRAILAAGQPPQER